MGSTELQMLWLSLALGVVHLAITAAMSVGKRGLPWALGPRDEEPAPLSKGAARMERAWKNYLETLPIFIGAVLLNAITMRHADWSAIGAMMYFGARVVFIPVYAMGIPVVRTLVWTVSVVGIVIILASSMVP